MQEKVLIIQYMASCVIIDCVKFRYINDKNLEKPALHVMCTQKARIEQLSKTVKNRKMKNRLTCSVHQNGKN